MPLKGSGERCFYFVDGEMWGTAHGKMYNSADRASVVNQSGVVNAPSTTPPWPRNIAAAMFYNCNFSKCNALSPRVTFLGAPCKNLSMRKTPYVADGEKCDFLYQLVSTTWSNCDSFFILKRWKNCFWIFGCTWEWLFNCSWKWLMSFVVFWNL